MNIRVVKFGAVYDIVGYNEAGTSITTLATAYHESYARCICILLSQFKPCLRCGVPVKAGPVSLCQPCIEAEIDPMEPDHKALAGKEPMTAYSDSREAAGV